MRFNFFFKCFFFKSPFLKKKGFSGETVFSKVKSKEMIGNMYSFFFKGFNFLKTVDFSMQLVFL